MIKNIKKNEAQKQLIKFRHQLHNLLIKYPEIRLAGDRNGDIYASITPNEPYSKTEYVYLPASGKKELVTQYALGK